MPNDADSRVILHRDGYVEITFSGLQSAERLQELADAAKSLLQKKEPARVSVLIDARNGRVNRDARSLATISRIGRVRNLHKLAVLISDDPYNTESGRETNLIVTVLAGAIGFRPKYFTDEAEARALVQPLSNP